MENNTPAETASEAAEKTEPKTIKELVNAIDISNVSIFDIVSDLISGIQQLAMRATIALGLLERIKTSLDTESEATEPSSTDESKE